MSREAKEECGLDVAIEREAGRVVRPGLHEGTEYHITDFICSLQGGALSPGDDAVEACWVHPSDFVSLPLTAGLRDALAAWGVI